MTGVGLGVDARPAAVGLTYLAAGGASTRNTDLSCGTFGVTGSTVVAAALCVDAYSAAFRGVLLANTLAFVAGLVVLA